MAGFVQLLACAKPAPDPALCTPGAADCTLGKRCGSARDCDPDGGSISCIKGVCMVSCQADGTCGAGQACGELDGKQWCLVPCESGVCPAGAPCKMFWGQRREVCAFGELGGACASFVSETTCATCGSQYFTTQCEGGSVCAGRSTCSLAGLNKCDCWTGYGTRCDGTPCVRNGINECVGPDYHCNSTTLVPSSCIDEPHETAGKCRCRDGREIPAVCGETSSCEHRCSNGCSLTAQDCPDSATPKCTYLYDLKVPTDSTSVARARAACVEETGTQPLGASCARAVLADGGVEVGRDDCAKGLICIRSGAPTGELRCRKLCTATSECGAGQVCARGPLTYPPSGYCLPDASCTLGGTECGAGRSCVQVLSVEARAVPACKFDGAVAAGGSCSNDSDCAANLRCGGGVCR